MIAADWNESPAALAETSFDVCVDGVILATCDELGTYCLASATSNIDYFVVRHDLAKVLAPPLVRRDAPTPPHSPCQLLIPCKLSSVTRTVVRRVQALPAVPVFGPR